MFNGVFFGFEKALKDFHRALSKDLGFDIGTELRLGCCCKRVSHSTPKVSPARTSLCESLSFVLKGFRVRGFRVRAFEFM